MTGKKIPKLPKRLLLLLRSFELVPFGKVVRFERKGRGLPFESCSIEAKGDRKGSLNNNLLQQVSKRKQKEKEKMLKEDFLVSGQLSSSDVRKREGNRRKTWRKKEK